MASLECGRHCDCYSPRCTTRQEAKGFIAIRIYGSLSRPGPTSDSSHLSVHHIQHQQHQPAEIYFQRLHQFGGIFGVWDTYISPLHYLVRTGNLFFGGFFYYNREHRLGDVHSSVLHIAFNCKASLARARYTTAHNHRPSSGAEFLFCGISRNRSDYYTSSDAGGKRIGGVAGLLATMASRVAITNEGDGRFSSLYSTVVLWVRFFMRESHQRSEGCSIVPQRHDTSP